MTERPATVCPLCGVGCRLRPGTEARAKGVRGPANPEGRLCGKGIGAFDVADNRLTEPLVRRDGDLEPASWDTALERAARSLRAVRRSMGPDGLAFLGAPHCTNEENYLLQKLARMVGTNNVDNRARLCHVSAARTLADRLGWPATTNRLADIDESDVIIVAGANPAERQPVAFNSFVRPAVADGTTLVHVDPVGNWTTRLADHHVAPRPGQDAAVFDLLAAHVLANNGVDRAFVADRTRGFRAFRESIADLDRERAAATADLESATIASVGEELVAANRVAAMVGTGIDGGGGAAEALLDLLLLTGSVGRPGTGVFILRGLANEQGATDAGCVPDRLPGHQPVSDPTARDRVAAEWGVRPPSVPGTDAQELLEVFGSDVRGALVVGENPAVSKRDREWVRRRLDGLDALVVVDVMRTGTTDHADVVLPAAAGVEKSGTLTNLERRVQRTSAVASPPGDARPDLAVLSELGARLTGSRSAFDYEGPAQVFDELTRVAPTHAGGSYDDLDSLGGQWPFDTDGILYRQSFATPDGRASFGTARLSPNHVPTQGLILVTGGRTSEFSDDDAPAVLKLAPSDAASRGLDTGDSVRVIDGETVVRAQVRVDEGTRSGTVYLPAPVADPLLRSAGFTVRIEGTT